MPLQLALVLGLAVTVIFAACPVHGSPVDAFVEVIGAKYHEFSAVQALFGPRLRNGHPIEGIVLATSQRSACVPVAPANKTLGVSFLLIPDDQRVCSYDRQVWNIQNAGYEAALVYCTFMGCPLKQISGSDRNVEDSIEIPSVYVGYAAGVFFKNEQRWPLPHVVLRGLPTWDLGLYLIIGVSCFLVILLIISICILISLIRRWRNSRPRTSRDARQAFVKKNIPIYKFRSGDQYELCAICLEDFKVGDKLRVLPCVHAYHAKCIDPWLTNDSDLCPLCKKSIFGEQAEDAAATAENQPGTSNENAPLLPPRPPRTSRRFASRARVNSRVRSPWPPRDEEAGSDDSDSDNNNQHGIPVTTSVQVHSHPRLVTLARGYGAIGRHDRRNAATVHAGSARVPTDNVPTSGGIVNVPVVSTAGISTRVGVRQDVGTSAGPSGGMI